MKSKKTLKSHIDELSLELSKEIKNQDIIKIQDFVLEKVIQIMDKISYEIRKGEIKQRTDEEINDVYQKYLNLNKIQTQYKNIDDYLDAVIDKVFQTLKQKKVKLNYDLFERGNSEIVKNGNGEKIEFKKALKNKLFLRVLYNLGIDFSKVKEYEEKLNPERMRKVPYIIYHIFDENINKTVLVCDQIGQATFVYDGIIDPLIFQIIEKGEEIDGKRGLKIVYSKKSFENNLKIALEKGLSFEEKEEKIVNEEEKSDEQTLEDYEKYFIENPKEFEDFGVKILDDKTIDLNNIGSPQKIDLFGGKAITILRNLNKLFGNDIGEIRNKFDSQKILKMFFERLGYKVILYTFEALDDYKKYYEENPKEFEDFGVKILENKIINLNDVGNPQKINLFGGNAYTTLRNLNKLFGNDIGQIINKTDIGQIINKTDAKKILKMFFERLGYKVILDYQLKTLDDYKKYYEENPKDFIDFGVKILEDKTIDLNDVLNPCKLKLFGGNAYIALRNLNKLFGNDIGQITNKTDAQKILKMFFERLGYKFTSNIKEKVVLKTLEDYEKYFKENSKEFEDFGVKILENKTIDLNYIGDTQRIDLFGGSAKTTLKNLNKLFGNYIGEIINKYEAQKVLKMFFERLGYKVILDYQLKTLDDYKKYYEENPKEFEDFGVKILENKTIDLNYIGSTNGIDLFGGLAKTRLKNLNKLFGNDIGQIINKTDAKKILKMLFERLGYKVILDDQLKTLDDYKKYYEENPKEFIDFGVKILEDKTIDLNGIGNPQKFELFGGNAYTRLRNLNKLFGNDIGLIKNISNSQKILKMFFESMGYKVV